MHLIEFCYTIAQKYIFEGKYANAVPAALHSLRFRRNLYGLSSVELVPAYLLLSEASLGKWNSLSQTSSAVFIFMVEDFFPWHQWQNFFNA